MSTNVVSVASGMEQTTTSLASLSTATEEMTSTIGEIAGNSEKARRITAEATVEAAHITERIAQLGEAARDIGKVTETITEISSQTNLLALNATIEAARAGSAGKGVAVVATEIKALAQQTAAATEDIRARIGGVQSAATGSISEIEKVSGVIRDVSDIVASIAAAIEQQSTTTKDIARNIGEASRGGRCHSCAWPKPRRLRTKLPAIFRAWIAQREKWRVAASRFKPAPGTFLWLPSSSRPRFHVSTSRRN